MPARESVTPVGWVCSAMPSNETLYRKHVHTAGTSMLLTGATVAHDVLRRL